MRQLTSGDAAHMTARNKLGQSFIGNRVDRILQNAENVKAL